MRMNIYSEEFLKDFVWLPADEQVSMCALTQCVNEWMHERSIVGHRLTVEEEACARAIDVGMKLYPRYVHEMLDNSALTTLEFQLHQ
jgi:hypothetical protein